MDIYIYIKLFIVFDCAGSSLLRGPFSSCSKWGCSLVVVQGLLIAMASLVALHKLQGVGASVAVAHGLSSCGSRDLDCRLSSCGARA